MLVHTFLERYGRELEKAPTQVSPEVLEVLINYPWPGNVRELQNVIKRALAWARQEMLTLEDLPDELVVHAGDSPRPDAGSFFHLRERRIAAFEQEYFQALLQSSHGDVSAAAREAQLPRGTLYRLLKKYELNPADFRAGSVQPEPMGARGDRTAADRLPAGSP